MTMRVLLSGHLMRDPERKFATSGKVYGKAMLRVAAKQRDANDPDSQLVFVVAFYDMAEALLALKQGDAVSIAGALEVRAAMYMDKPTANLNVVADRIMDIRRPPRPPRSEKTDTRAVPDGEGVAAMPDDIPF